MFCRRQLRIFTSLAGWCLLPAWLSAAITVATYNLENYLVTDRMVDGVYRPAYPKPQKSRQAICATVAGISPDVLAVQEMGSAAFLEDFRRELKEAGQDFPHAVLLEAGDLFGRPVPFQLRSNSLPQLAAYRQLAELWTKSPFPRELFGCFSPVAPQSAIAADLATDRRSGPVERTRDRSDRQTPNDAP